MEKRLNQVGGEGDGGGGEVRVRWSAGWTFREGGEGPVGVLRDSGKTKLNFAAHGAAQPEDELLRAVREAAAAEFTVLGEIGRASDGTIAYLARDLVTKKLVALRLTRGVGNEYLLEIAERLDPSVPAPSSSCARCQAEVRGWARFCTQCGFNLWSDPAAGGRRNKTELLEAVQQATQNKFEILGEMGASGVKGIVYFARDLATGRIEALRLQQEGDGEFSIGLTGVLSRYAAPISGHRPRGA